MIKVRATQMLQYAKHRVRAGQVFDIKDESEFAPHCMMKVEESAVDIHPSDFVPPVHVPKSVEPKEGKKFSEVIQGKKPVKKAKAKKEEPLEEI
jgi:hypothetical protein